MRKETFGGLFDIFFMSFKIITRNLPMLAVLLTMLLISNISTEVLIYQHDNDQSNEFFNDYIENKFKDNPDTDGYVDNDASDYGYSGTKFLIGLMIVLAVVTMSYFAMACIITTKNNFTEDYANFLYLLKDRGLKLLSVLIIQYLVIIVGFLLLIIPGIYLSLRMCLIPYIVVYENKGFSEAFEKSTYLMNGNKVTFLLFSFVAGMLVGVLVGMIATIFLILGMDSNIGSAILSGNLYQIALIITYILIVVFLYSALNFAVLNIVYLKRARMAAGIEEEEEMPKESNQGQYVYAPKKGKGNKDGDIGPDGMGKQ